MSKKGKAIEFKKDHPIGIVKGSIRRVDPAHAAKLVAAGYAKEISEEDYAKKKAAFDKEQAEKVVENQKNAMANNVKKIRKRLKNLKITGDIGKKDEGKKDQKVYRALDDLDVDQHPALIEQEGLELGDMVLVNHDDELILDNGKAVKKPA